MTEDSKTTVRDLVGYGKTGATASWPDSSRIAICVIVNYEEGSEISFASGDSANEPPQEFSYPILPVRDFGNETIFEYGSRAGIWRLQRLFDSMHIPLTIQGCARAFELNPEVSAWIRETHQDVCCHGYRWENVSTLDRDTERDHLLRAIALIRETCGERPYGWYSRQPRSNNTRELLVEEGGFLYDSDSFADDLPYYVSVAGHEHLVIPYSFTLNDGLFMSGQSYSSPSSFLDYLRRHFDYIWDEGATQPKLMSIGLHPRFTGQPSRTHALREFLLYVADHEGVWFTSRTDLARWWLAHNFSNSGSDGAD